MKIGIALSGGGTRGLVHVGVLQALEDHKIYPDIISGTSAGALIGALYANGYKPKEIMDMSLQNNIRRMLNLHVPSKGFVTQAYLRKQLVKFLPKNSFESLKKPLYVAIANLNSGQIEYVHTGELHDVVLASSAVPVLFEPIKIDEHYYVDGGIIKNLPVSILKGKADKILAVNLVPQMEVESDNLKGISGVAIRVFNLAVLNNIMPELAQADIVIEPAEIESFSRYRFNNLEDMYKIGYNETMKHMEDIKKAFQAA